MGLLVGLIVVVGIVLWARAAMAKAKEEEQRRAREEALAARKRKEEERMARYASASPAEQRKIKAEMHLEAMKDEGLPNVSNAARTAHNAYVSAKIAALRFGTEMTPAALQRGIEQHIGYVRMPAVFFEALADTLVLEDREDLVAALPEIAARLGLAA